MNNQNLTDSIKSTFTGDVILHMEEPDGIITLTCDAANIIPVIKTLRDNLGFIFLTDLCGIHYPDRDKQLGVIYHLHNLTENIRIRVKTFVSISKPQLESLTGLFASANWMERETFDFYGIQFDNHPNLKRILNVDYMDYHPLRKEYPLEDPTREDKDDRFFGR
jgi:NADH-quinone oxidoreductase subunit C